MWSRFIPYSAQDGELATQHLQPPHHLHWHASATCERELEEHNAMQNDSIDD
jgi:hypothetical protein